ncbi:Cap-Gly Domain-Containing Linker Protein 2 [Manis pentadactyla]|nr:Cap-Gly Domain-Containing Linker Protein 2 [Manis pentadactyla]
MNLEKAITPGLSKAEVEKLRVANEKYTQEVVDLKAKVQQTISENMGLMDNWKSKLDSLASDHQKFLEDLKATLNSGPGAQQKEIRELKAVMEGTKMEDQLELGNLQAKHNIETAMHVKEKEGLWQKLQETQNELARLQQHWQAQLEVQAGQHQIELPEAWEQCHDASCGCMSWRSWMWSLQDKLNQRDKEVTALMSQTEMLRTQVSALESMCKSGEKKVDTLQKKWRLEAELEAVSRKTHDASGQLVLVSQELLRKGQSLNELRVLLLEASRHSPGPGRDLSCKVHKAEWWIKEQKLKDDIRACVKS